MSQASAAGGSDEVGSVADEAARLIWSLADWTRRHAAGEAPLADDCGGHDHRGAGGASAAGEESDAGGACAWCPVCRAHAWLRQLNPDTRAHLGAAGASLAAAMASLLAPPTATSRHDGVERIVVDDRPWPEETW